MSNVIALNAPSRLTPLKDRVSSLIECFAFHRRKGDDVYWLKENAELLNVLETTGATPGEEAFAPLAGFYENLEERIDANPKNERDYLNLIFLYTFFCRPNLTFLIAARMVKLTIEHGVSAVSSVGFGYFGTMLCRYA